MPWAFYLFLNGKAEVILEELNTKTTTFCHLYQSLSTTNSTNGRCTDYKYRGLICRLFGYAASRDKYGELRLATCKIIKENQQEKEHNFLQMFFQNVVSSKPYYRSNEKFCREQTLKK